MTHREQMLAAILAVALLVSGFTWLFGPFGLIGTGVVLTAVALFTNEREDDA